MVSRSGLTLYCVACAMVGKYDVIHKTGSTQRIATPPEEEPDTATGNIHRKFAEVQMSGS